MPFVIQEMILQASDIDPLGMSAQVNNLQIVDGLSQKQRPSDPYAILQSISEVYDEQFPLSIHMAPFDVHLDN
mgnify:CR=1 FL=1